MSSHCLKLTIMPFAAAAALGLAGSSPLWAQAAAAQTGEVNPSHGMLNESGSSHVRPADLRLAMMNDMDEMGMKKMEKMPKKGMAMGDKKMKGSMPAEGPMSGPGPGPDSPASMQDPLATPSGSDMMGRMRGSMKARGPSNMAPTASLPGFPGASHLYHVGSTGFFLDHPEHITLSTEQQTALNRIKVKTSLDRATFDRRIEEAEQELWTLTAADAPDTAKIEARVRSIDTLRGDQRLAFIRAVGEAGKVLTVDQQNALLGTQPTAVSKPPPAASRPAPMPAPMKTE